MWFETSVEPGPWDDTENIDANASIHNRSRTFVTLSKPGSTSEQDLRLAAAEAKITAAFTKLQALQSKVFQPGPDSTLVASSMSSGHTIRPTGVDSSFASSPHSTHLTHLNIDGKKSNAALLGNAGLKAPEQRFSPNRPTSGLQNLSHHPNLDSSSPGPRRNVELSAQGLLVRGLVKLYKRRMELKLHRIFGRWCVISKTRTVCLVWRRRSRQEVGKERLVTESITRELSLVRSEIRMRSLRAAIAQYIQWRIRAAFAAYARWRRIVVVKAAGESLTSLYHNGASQRAEDFVRYSTQRRLHKIFHAWRVLLLHALYSNRQNISSTPSDINSEFMRPRNASESGKVHSSRASAMLSPGRIAEHSPRRVPSPYRQLESDGSLNGVARQFQTQSNPNGVRTDLQLAISPENPINIARSTRAEIRTRAEARASDLTKSTPPRASRGSSLPRSQPGNDSPSFQTNSALRKNNAGFSNEEENISLLKSGQTSPTRRASPMRDTLSSRAHRKDPPTSNLVNSDERLPLAIMQGASGKLTVTGLSVAFAAASKGSPVSRELSPPKPRRSRTPPPAPPLPPPSSKSKSESSFHQSVTPSRFKSQQEASDRQSDQNMSDGNRFRSKSVRATSSSMPESANVSLPVPASILKGLSKQAPRSKAGTVYARSLARSVSSSIIVGKGRSSNSSRAETARASQLSRSFAQISSESHASAKSTARPFLTRSGNSYQSNHDSTPPSVDFACPTPADTSDQSSIESDSRRHREEKEEYDDSQLVSNSKHLVVHPAGQSMHKRSLSGSYAKLYDFKQQKSMDLASSDRGARDISKETHVPGCNLRRSPRNSGSDTSVFASCKEIPRLKLNEKDLVGGKASSTQTDLAKESIHRIGAKDLSLLNQEQINSKEHALISTPLRKKDNIQSNSLASTSKSSKSKQSNPVVNHHTPVVVNFRSESKAMAVGSAKKSPLISQDASRRAIGKAESVHAKEGLDLPLSAHQSPQPETSNVGEIHGVDVATRKADIKQERKLSRTPARAPSPRSFAEVDKLAPAFSSSLSSSFARHGRGGGGLSLWTDDLDPATRPVLYTRYREPKPHSSRASPLKASSRNESNSQLCSKTTADNNIIEVDSVKKPHDSRLTADDGAPNELVPGIAIQSRLSAKPDVQASPLPIRGVVKRAKFDPSKFLPDAQVTELVRPGQSPGLLRAQQLQRFVEQTRFSGDSHYQDWRELQHDHDIQDSAGDEFIGEYSQAELY